MAIMCILNQFHSDYFVLVGFFGGGLVLAVFAATLIINEVLHYPVENVDEDATTATEQDGGEDKNVVSDHIYVEQLLLQHDGQLYQRQIVAETGWSKAKVSVLLSDMEADEDLTKIRLGRENLVVLPGHEPELLTSGWNNDKEYVSR